MKLREKAAQMICADFRFDAPDFERITRLVREGIGGVCLFGGTVFDVAPFVNSLQKLAKIPLLIASDYEKGAGHQVRGATVLPRAMALGAANSESLAELAGRVTAREARAMGVNWIFAPVLDLQVRAENPIINVRSFGSDPDLVIRLGRAFARGVKQAGALSCGKHYPGHGDVTIDSHLELPRLKEPGVHLRPFTELAGDLDSIMSGHLLVESIDPDFPVSLSAKAIGALRRTFEGLIVTDALMMGAIKAPDAALRAAKAGNDVVLYPTDPFAAIDALESVDEEILDRAVKRLIAVKRRIVPEDQRIADPERMQAIVGSKPHLDAAAKIAEASVTKLSGDVVKSARLAVVTDGDRETPALEVFRDELAKRGVLKSDAETGILALCSQVRAFAGRVDLDPGEIAEGRAALGDVKRVVAVSFGSPYVHRLVKSDGAWAVYDEGDASQRAAARAICGEIPAPGRLPVTM